MRSTTKALVLLLSATPTLATSASAFVRPLPSTKTTLQQHQKQLPKFQSRRISDNVVLISPSSLVVVHARLGRSDHNAEDGKRRKTIFGGAALSSLPFFFGGKINNKANAALTVTITSTSSVDGDGVEKPVADFPMRRLRLPKGGLGREYIIVQLYIEGKGPFDFMVDSGLTTELITPHLQQMLDLNTSGSTKQGLSAGVASQTQSLVELNDVSLCCGSFASGKDFFVLPGPLHAIVADFPQEHMDPAHDPVEGMIGMEVLEQFDVDFDFPAGRLRLWKPHTVEAVAKKANMSTIEAVVINETRLLGFRVVSSSAIKKDATTSAGVVPAQPFLGVVDCGASFSVVNRSAASLLGLPPPPQNNNNDAYDKNPMVAGVGVDGKPQLMPTANDVRLSYCNNANKDTRSFEAPPQDWTPWDPILLAIGDLPVFTNLLGDGRTPYRGPAGIIGLDILTQRRLILETGDDDSSSSSSSSRRRRIYVGK